MLVLVNNYILPLISLSLYILILLNVSFLLIFLFANSSVNNSFHQSKRIQIQRWEIRNLLSKILFFIEKDIAFEIFWKTILTSNLI